MSSLVRTIQRRAKRDMTVGPGSKLGLVNPKAKDLLARLAKEASRGRG